MPNVMSKLMTLEEQATKEEIMDRLGQQGYPTYAHLFDKFALHLTADPSVVGYMVPDRGIIVLNRFLSLNQVSTIVRHEILHQYLEHGKRELAKLGSAELIDASLHELSNIAADYEISNRGYTDADKRIARAIKLNGEYLTGLVTEDRHQDWTELSYEEMLDKLIEEREKKGSESQQARQQAQIGSKGNDKMQQAEAAQRAAQIAQENAESQADNAKSEEEKEEAEEKVRKASEAVRKAQEVIDELSKASGQSSDGESSNGETQDSDSQGSSDSDEGAFSDYELTPQDLAEIDETLAEIRDILSNADVGRRVQRDSANAKQKEKDEIKRREEERYKNHPLTKFVSSLNGFIEREIKYMRDRTWKKFNPTYAAQDLLRQGKATTVQRKTPVVQVYYDRSGSWDGNESKENIGKRGIDSLQKYVKDGLLKVEHWYFDTRVSQSPANMGGGTYGTPIIENIKATKPDNVVIITDSDITDCTEHITVPGAVWFLFVNGVSDNLKEHISGKRLTKSYEINS